MDKYKVKEWFSSKELSVVEGMPSTIQGINRRARAENWTARKRSGVRGKALEYHIHSFPPEIKKILLTQEDGGSYVISTIQPFQLWMTAFEQFDQDEKNEVASWLLRNGIKDLITFIKQHKKDE